LEVSGNLVTLEREIAGGVQVVEVSTPVVISCAKGMAEQRIPNMRGIMAARTRQLTVIPAAQVQELTSYVVYDLPVSKGACKMIDPDNMDELVELLHNEAKVI
jgi:electron transfer flavoprotein beta subunit